MNPGAFEACGVDHYGRTFYTNVKSAIRMFFDPEEMRVLDLGCGSGVLTREMQKDGFHTIGFDIDEALLECVEGETVCGDLTCDELPEAEAVLMVNTTGHFQVKQLRKLLRRLPGNRLIANFLVLEDQEYLESNRLALRKGNKFYFNMGKYGVFHLNAVPIATLKDMFHEAGFDIIGEYHYYDFKYERLFCLERHP